MPAFRCPSCGASLNVFEEMLGRWIQCGQCLASFAAMPDEPGPASFTPSGLDFSVAPRPRPVAAYVACGLTGLLAGGLVVALVLKGSFRADQPTPPVVVRSPETPQPALPPRPDEAPPGPRTPAPPQPLPPSTLPGVPRPGRPDQQAPETAPPPEASGAKAEPTPGQRLRFPRPVRVLMTYGDAEMTVIDGTQWYWLYGLDNSTMAAGQHVALEGEFTFKGTKSYLRPGRDQERAIYLWDATPGVSVRVTAPAPSGEPAWAPPRGRNTRRHTPEREGAEPGVSDDVQVEEVLDTASVLEQRGQDDLTRGHRAVGQAALRDARKRYTAIQSRCPGTPAAAHAQSSLSRLAPVLAEEAGQIRDAVNAYLARQIGNAGAFEVLSIGEPELRKVRDNDWQLTTVVRVRFRVLAVRGTTLTLYLAVKDGEVIQACQPSRSSEMFGGGQFAR